jgi:CRISPR-associated protein Cmr3
VKHLKLTPLDTLFFRDGRPFNAGETGQMEVGSVFPPSANTVVGCLRAAFAKELGWDGRGAWNGAITKKLGDGDALSPLTFQGPYLLKDGECLFPVPAHLLAAHENEQMAHLTFLRPSDEALECDLSALQPADETQSKNLIQKAANFFSPNSEDTNPNTRKVRLPETLPVVAEGKSVTGFKPLGQAYVTLRGMQQVLAGEKPALEDIIAAKDLWTSETRIGIQRNNTTRTTEEGALYQVAQTRLAPGVSLGMRVTGYEGDIPQSATLGGESRMAWLEPTDCWQPPMTPEFKLEGDDDVLRYMVVLVTPAQLTGWQTPGGKLADLPGTIVSACVGKPVLIGGWDSVKRAPKDLQAYLPTGSVFFVEAKKADQSQLETIQKRHNTHIGESTNWGYGQIFIGVWP